jgi:hypothetical protein
MIFLVKLGKTSLNTGVLFMKKRFLALFYCSFFALNALWTMSPEKCETWDCDVELIGDIEEEAAEAQDPKKHARKLLQSIAQNIDNKTQFLNNYRSWKNQLLDVKRTLAQDCPQQHRAAIDQAIENLDQILNNPQSRWHKGKALVNLMLTKPQAFDQLFILQKFTLDDICNVIWFFYVYAALHGNPFDEGTFVITGSKIFITKLRLLLGSQKEYPRISSHFKEYKVQHFGLDIPEDLRDKQMLPCDKATILFAHLSDEKLFIKIENYGTQTISDLTAHGKEFVEAQLRKIPSARTTLGLKSDDDESYRKERVPSSLTSAWKTFVDVFIQKKDASMAKNYIELGKIGGVQNINDLFVKIPLPQELTAQEQAANNVLEKELAPYDLKTLRLGREIIIEESALKNFIATGAPVIREENWEVLSQRAIQCAQQAPQPPSLLDKATGLATKAADSVCTLAQQLKSLVLQASQQSDTKVTTDEQKTDEFEEIKQQDC